MHEALSLVAPGRPLRAGLDRILQGRMGALIVVGDSPQVLAISTGGFLLDAEVTAQRLSELAKMDGAIVTSSDATRIARANVHLVPNPSTPTSETGTRHRSAERVARSLGVVVIAVSEELRMVTVYWGNDKRVLEPVTQLWTRTNQLLQTLERFRGRLDVAASSLSSLEVADLVTVRDVAEAVQRAEMSIRVARQIEEHLVELGEEGAMLRLQLDELTNGLDALYRLIIRDFLPDNKAKTMETALNKLQALTMEEIADVGKVAISLKLVEESDDLSQPISSKGFRILSRLPKLPGSVANDIVDYFGSLQRVMRATEDDLGEVAGVGEARARSVKEGLARITEASIIDRYRN